jgi:hypothetical protein
MQVTLGAPRLVGTPGWWVKWIKDFRHRVEVVEAAGRADPQLARPVLEQSRDSLCTGELGLPGDVLVPLYW